MLIRSFVIVLLARATSHGLLVRDVADEGAALMAAKTHMSMLDIFDSAVAGLSGNYFELRVAVADADPTLDDAQRADARRCADEWLRTWSPSAAAEAAAAVRVIRHAAYVAGTVGSRELRAAWRASDILGATPEQRAEHDRLLIIQARAFEAARDVERRWIEAHPMYLEVMSAIAVHREPVGIAA